MADPTFSQNADPVSIFNDTTGNQLAIDASGSIGVTQSTSPWVVSGTVTANLGTIAGVATETSLVKLTLTQGSTTSGQSGPLVMGSVSTANPAYTNGQTSPLSLTPTGSLRTDNTTWFGSTAPTVGQKTMANSIPVVISSDQGTISVSPTTSADAEGGIVYRVVLGNYILTGSPSVFPMLYIRNPVGSGKSFYLRRTIMNNRIKTQSYQLFMYTNPTVSANGTTKAILNTNTGSANTSVMLATTAPTITSAGTLYSISATGANQNDNERTAYVDILAPGQSYYFAGLGSNNNTGADLIVEWTEK